MLCLDGKAGPRRPEEGLMKYIVGLPLDPETLVEVRQWGCLSLGATAITMSIHRPNGTRSDASFFRWLATGALSNATSLISAASVLCLSALPSREVARAIVLREVEQSPGFPSAELCLSAEKLVDEVQQSSGSSQSLLCKCWTRALADLVLDMQKQEQARGQLLASVSDSAPNGVGREWANYTMLMAVRLCAAEPEKLA